MRLTQLCAYHNAFSTTSKKRPQKIATLDCHATLVGTENKSALFCYKGFRAYHPYSVWWAQQQVVLHSEFRDGNVPAGWNILSVIKTAVEALPEGVEQVFMRQDTAAYETGIMAWCERGHEHPKVSRIQFTISADVTPVLRDEISKVTKWFAEYVLRKRETVATGRE